MYLLNIDTLIYILKGNPIVEKNLQNQAYHVSHENQARRELSALMELYYGAY